MCRECDSATAREQAASDLLAKCRSVSPVGDALRSVYPLEPAPFGMVALAAKLDRMLLP